MVWVVSRDHLRFMVSIRLLEMRLLLMIIINWRQYLTLLRRLASSSW